MNPWAPQHRHAGVSVVLKAWNEEAQVVAAIRSAWAAAPEVAPLPVEVVLADGLSDDRTVALACDLEPPAGCSLRVVQLRSASDRSCGAGVQLGYEWACGRWLLLMDADMELQPGFLAAALRHLRAHPRVAGVTGTVAECSLRNGADRIRQRKAARAAAGPEPWLEGGGLYRREALAAVDDWAADPRLRAFEEADLGLRLREAGWALHRLPRVWVRHHGHEQGTLALLRARWRSGRARAAGLLCRLAAARGNVRGVAPLLVRPLLAGAWWLVLGSLLAMEALGPAVGPSSGAGVPVTAAAAWLVASGLGAGAVAWRRRDPVQVVAAVLDWHLTLVAALQGLCRPVPRRRPWVAARLVLDTAQGGDTGTPAWRAADPLVKREGIAPPDVGGSPSAWIAPRDRGAGPAWGTRP